MLHCRRQKCEGDGGDFHFQTDIGDREDEMQLCEGQEERGGRAGQKIGW